MNVDIVKELKGLVVKTRIEGSVSNFSVHEVKSIRQGEMSLHIGRSRFLTIKYNSVL